MMARLDPPHHSVFALQPPSFIPVNTAACVPVRVTNHPRAEGLGLQAPWASGLQRRRPVRHRLNHGTIVYLGKIRPYCALHEKYTWNTLDRTIDQRL